MALERSKTLRLEPRPSNLALTVSCNSRPCKDFLVPRGSIVGVSHDGQLLENFGRAVKSIK